MSRPESGEVVVINDYAHLDELPKMICVEIAPGAMATIDRSAKGNTQMIKVLKKMVILAAKSGKLKSIKKHENNTRQGRDYCIHKNKPHNGKMFMV